MNAETSETWQIESGGQIIDTDFGEMTAMIDRGELLRIDRVRKGDLRWIEAGKIPSLVAVFNAKDGDQPPKPVITLTQLGPPVMPGSMSEPHASAVGTNVALNSTSFPPAHAGGSDTTEPVCAMHPDVPAVFVCGTCFSNFCKACPNSFGSNVKICPYCGAMCNSIAKVEAARTEAVNHAAAMGDGFGFGDFINALAYPFKFSTSLILGAVMYMFCSIGTGAMGFGGIFMMGAAIGSYMLANTLTFGVLSNTVENFSQGKLGENFMPTFDEFSIWDDVVHPFFLSIGAWVVSFGPLILLMIVAFFFVTSAVTSEMNGLQSDAARTVNPDLPYAAKAVEQSKAVRELMERANENQRRRIEEIERGEFEEYQPLTSQAPRSIAPEAEEFNRKSKLADEAQKQTINNGEVPPNAISPNMTAEAEEAEFERLNNLIQDTRKAQLEGVVGKAPDTVEKENSALWTKIIGYGVIFLLVGGICLLWGLFYFPAACAVAGYTHSFGATLNPAVGLDTIKRLGLDYVKILLMGLALLIMSGIVTGILSLIFLPFGKPGFGNIPAKAVGSLFGFYFSVVFSCILGFAMFKAGDRLKLPS